MIGIGAMLHVLGGGSPKSPDEFYGREVVGASVTEDCLTIRFAGGGGIKVFDNGQSCCESRYMRTDDDPACLIGGTLTSIEGKDVPCDVSSEYGEHEVCFLEIMTTKGSITIANHNEHNGYYGGFDMSIEEVK